MSEHREEVTVGGLATVETSTRVRMHREVRQKTVRDRGLGLLLLDSIVYTWWGSCTHEISAVWLPEQDLKNDNTS